MKRAAPEGCCRSRRRWQGAPARPEAGGCRQRRGIRTDMKLAVTNLDNESVGEIELADAVFGLPVRKDILRARGQLAARQAPRRAPTRPRASATSAARPRSRTSRRAPAAPARAALRSPQFRGGGSDLRPGRAQPCARPAEEGAQAGAEDRAVGQAGRRQADRLDDAAIAEPKTKAAREPASASSAGARC